MTLKEGHYKRFIGHLQEKYAEGGYLKLWFPCSPNADRLKALREVICSEQMLRKHFEKIYREESL